MGNQYFLKEKKNKELKNKTAFEIKKTAFTKNTAQ